MRNTPLVLAASLAAAMVPQILQAATPLGYTVRAPQPASHYLEVELDVPPEYGCPDLAFSVWTPGGYSLHPHAADVLDLVTVAPSGAPLSAGKTDLSTWHVDCAGGAGYTAKIRVHALALRTPYSAHVDDRLFFANAVTVLPYLPAHQDAPASLRIDPPSGWKVICSLRRAADVLLGKRFRVRFFRHDPTVPRLLLALFLAARFDLGPGGVALLDSDPELLGFFARRMAPELGLVPSPSPETAAAWSLAESEESARRLVGVLARLSSSARDEELFVVVADLGILPPPQLETLSVELRRARAHRHRVVVFWPEVEPPSAGPLPEGISRLARNMPQFLRRLRSLGIPAGPLDPERGFQTILSQLKHLTRRQGVRSC